MNEKNDEHLSAELMQGFLDGEVSERDAARVREHTACCPRCRSELDAWSTLFTGLGAIGDLAPSASFGQRVLESLPPHAPEHTPLWTRLLGRFPAAGRSVARAGVSATHPGPDVIQDFLGGILPQHQALGLEGHLHACRACRIEVEEWSAMLASLDGLPAFSPTPEFQERVMAHVRVQLAMVAARPTVGERLRLMAAGVSPRTRKRLAAFAGAGLTPVVVLALVAWTVFSHPLVTLGNLASFLWLVGSARIGGVVGNGLAAITESSALLGAYRVVELLAGSPAITALSATGLAAMTATAAWVIYRNVLVGPETDQLHAR